MPTKNKEMTIKQAIADLFEADRKIKKGARYACGLMPPAAAEHLKEGRASFFFESPDGQNGQLYYELRSLGWRHSKYAAEYYWKVRKDNIEIQYTEGDVYIVTKNRYCTACGYAEAQSGAACEKCKAKLIYKI